MIARPTGIGRFGRKWCLVVVLGAALALSACEPTPEESLRSAKAAVLAENPEVAEEHLAKVLKAMPESFDALRLEAQIHRLSEDYAQAEEALQSLWDERGFAEEGADLDTDQKRQRQLLEDDFVTLYKNWASSVDAKESPEIYEEILQKGLEKEPDSNRINTLLVEFYMVRGERLVEKGEKPAAADTFEKILDLRARSTVRAEVEERVSNLRFEAHEAKAYAYFNEKAKPKLVEAERYNVEEKTVSFERVFPLEEIVKASGQDKLDMTTKESQSFVRTYALRQAVKQLIEETTGLEGDFDYKIVTIPPKFSVGEEKLTDEAYELSGEVLVDALLREGFNISEKLRREAKKASPSEESEEAGEPDEGASENAGSEEGGE